MSKIAEQKALEAYPIKIDRIYYGLPLLNGAEPFTDDVNIHQRNAYIKGYDQAMQDVFEWIEKNILCGEMSSEDVRGFIIECKEYFKGEN